MSIASIAESLTALENAKQDIADAITAKGGTVGDGDGYADFAEDIGTISGGGGGNMFMEEIPITSADLFSNFRTKEMRFRKYYTHSEKDVESDTTLTSSVQCNAGDLVIALIATQSPLTVSNGWTIISTSNVNSQDTTSQRIAWAYKYAASAEESITVTQTTAKRIYINMIALPGTATFEDEGYQYKNNTAASVLILEKPAGLVLWGCSSALFGTGGIKLAWVASSGIPMEQLDGNVQKRLALGVDQTNVDSISFYPAIGSTLVIGCLKISGIEKLYDEVD